MLDIDSDDDGEGSNYDAKEGQDAMEDDDSDLEADQHEMNDTGLGSNEDGE